MTKQADCNRLALLVIQKKGTNANTSTRIAMPMSLQSAWISLFGTFSRYARCLLLAAALMPVPLLPADGVAAAQETFYVKVLVARVRQAPTTESPVLFRARRGDPVTILQKQGEWYHIKHPIGRTGWAHEKLFAATTRTGGQAAGQNYFLKSVNLTIDSDTKETVTFQLDGFHPPETFVLKGERPRVVCDFLNTRVQDSVGDRVESDGALVKDIRIAPYGGGAPRVRAVLDLTPGRTYVVKQTFFKKENRYTVTIAANGP